MTFNFKIATDRLALVLFDATNSENKGYIEVSEFSISEEDLRKRSCKFKTFTKIDITQSRWFVFAFYQRKAIFGGIILNTDYNEDDGSYSIQCQDFNRWLTTKTWFVNEEGNKTIHTSIKEICNEAIKKYDKKYYAGIESYYLADKKKYELYPAKMKESTEAIGVLTITEQSDKDSQGLNQKPGVYYEDKTLEEILRSLWSASNCAVDMYTDSSNVLRFDPINLESWQNPKSLYFTTKELSGYSYKNDATNIVTQVTIEDTDIYSNHTVTQPNIFKPKDLMGFDLVAYFGLLNVFVQNSNSTKTTTATTTTDTTATDSTTTTDGTTTDTTATDTAAQEEAAKAAAAKAKIENAESNEKLARAKFSEGLRDLMSFTIDFQGFIPELHTNMFVWFELPEKHILSNYGQMVAGIDKTITRGGSYVLNRYYVEKIDTSFDSNTIKTTVTLNPFASDLSSYYKIYVDAIEKYEQANCTSDSSTDSTGTGGTTSTEGATTTATITATGKPSTGQASKYYSYSQSYTKTWKNYCPLCHKSGLLQDNPKGVAEHEISCYPRGCGADYDVCTGGEKLSNPRAYLIDANGKSNTKTSVDTSIGGGTSSSGTATTSGATSSTGASSANCVNSSSGGATDMSQAGTVSAAVKTKTKQITSGTGIEAVKQLCEWNSKNIRWENEGGFYQTPDTTLKRMIANCCCKADLLLQMAACVGVIGTYVHVRGGKGGHVFCKFGDTYVDPTKKSGAWGNYAKGYGTLPGVQTKYPKKPF